MVQEMRRLKLWIASNIPGFHFLTHDQLSEATYNASCSNWNDFVERKKVLFKEVLRSNVWAYNSTFRKLHKAGHVGKLKWMLCLEKNSNAYVFLGTKLAGRHNTALGLQKKRLEDLIKLYNKEFCKP